MNKATAAALRSIVSGLRKSGAISEPHIDAIVAAMESEEPELKRWGKQEWISYRQLCIDIASDAGVTTSIEVAEPDEWNH
jgi:formate-dependent phosphoribosylglycinamide formyltransferase (GAR transformylase)